MADDDRYEPRGFLHLAIDYCEAAKTLFGVEEAGQIKLHFKHAVRYNLYCHSFELLLKAFLLTKGISKKELASFKFRHDLEKLLTESASKGLKHDEHTSIVLAWLNDYIRDQAFRYLRYGFQHLPADQDLEKVYDRLLAEVRRACETYERR